MTTNGTNREQEPAPSQATVTPEDILDYMIEGDAFPRIIELTAIQLHQTALQDILSRVLEIDETCDPKQLMLLWSDLVQIARQYDDELSSELTVMMPMSDAEVLQLLTVAPPGFTI